MVLKVLPDSQSLCLSACPLPGGEGPLACVPPPQRPASSVTDPKSAEPRTVNSNEPASQNKPLFLLSCCLGYVCWSQLCKNHFYTTLPTQGLLLSLCWAPSTVPWPKEAPEK